MAPRGGKRRKKLLDIQRDARTSAFEPGTALAYALHAVRWGNPRSFGSLRSGHGYSQPHPVVERRRHWRSKERRAREIGALGGQGPLHGDRPRLVRGHRFGGEGPRHALLARERPRGPRQEPEARLLPVAGIPHRPAAGGRAGQSRRRQAVLRGAGGSGRQPERAADLRAGCGAGEWRSRPARRLLHGEHGDARHPGLRLRHPLRPRAVPAGHPQRLAAGISGGVALLRQPVGVRAAGRHL